MNKRKILICNNHLQDFAGSELHCFEIADYFISIGYEAYVAAFVIGEPMTSKFKKIGVKLLTIPELSKLNDSYDIIWTHHRPVFYYIHIKQRIASKLFIHQMLSPFLEIEFFPLYSGSYIDNRLIFLANSYETKSLAIKQSQHKNIKIFHNTIPQTYLLNTKDTYESIPKKIAVISNHPPPELRAAMQLFEQEKKQTVFFGLHDNVTNITPSVLKDFDVIITIGKTVQYCLALKVPVYNYDYHGGLGYITLEELDELEKFNFSGRHPGTLKSPQSIHNEIKNNYKKALNELEELQKEAQSRYKIPDQLNKIIGNFSFNNEARSLDISDDDKLVISFCQPPLQLSKKRRRYKRILDKIRFFLPKKKENLA